MNRSANQRPTREIRTGCCCYPAEHEEIIALIRSERERTDAMTALITELREEITLRRNNGNGSGTGGHTENEH